jgi:hypothetical protein
VQLYHWLGIDVNELPMHPYIVNDKWTDTYGLYSHCGFDAYFGCALHPNVGDRTIRCRTIRRGQFVADKSSHGQFVPRQFVAGQFVAMMWLDYIIATNCPATNCLATNCPATNCPSAGFLIFFFADIIEI